MVGMGSLWLGREMVRLNGKERGDGTSLGWVGG